jgi:sugar lactone lactonase YvrE
MHRAYVIGALVLAASCGNGGSSRDTRTDRPFPDTYVFQLDQSTGLVDGDGPHQLDRPLSDHRVADVPQADSMPGAWMVSTLAGSGTQGLVNGPATSAQFDSPGGIAVDSTGKVYVADTFNHCIRVISGGQVTILAGTGNSGFADGPAASAQFHFPQGVEVDASGKVYVADSGNYRIRVISGGQVTTLAGCGTKGFANGAAAVAQFAFPIAIAVDGSGKVYVADMTNHRIRVISGGQVSTFAGSGSSGFADGPVASAQFLLPDGVAASAAGSVYVGDSDNNRVRLVSGGQVSTLAGAGSSGFADGPAASAQFHFPHGPALDTKGHILLADTTNNRIRVIASGQVSTLAGTGAFGFADGPAQQAQFNIPYDVAVDNAGNVYVADTGNHRIRLITH